MYNISGVIGCAVGGFGCGCLCCGVFLNKCYGFGWFWVCVWAGCSSVVANGLSYCECLEG